MARLTDFHRQQAASNPSATGGGTVSAPLATALPSSLPAAPPAGSSTPPPAVL
jgi:hypothetical protein